MNFIITTYCQTFKLGLQNYKSQIFLSQYSRSYNFKYLNTIKVLTAKLMVPFLYIVLTLFK